MNILILTGKFGMGHQSAALALEEHIRSAFPQAQVRVADLVEETFPGKSRGIYKMFAMVARHGGPVFNRLYRSLDREGPAMPVPAQGKFLKALHRLVKETKPQVVLSTLPLCTRLASEYKGKQGEFQLISCVTDIRCHSEWIAPHVDLYCVPSQKTFRELVKKGIDPQRVLVTGIPVRPAFHPAGKEEKREKEVLVMGGGLGLMPEDPEFYRNLARFPGVHVTVITGKNKELYAKLQGVHPQVEVLGFTNQVDKYLRRASLMLSKPGGLTLFEAIAAQVPLFAFHPTLEQEKENGAFLKEEKIGLVLPENPKAMSWLIEDALCQKGALEEMRRNMARLQAGMDLGKLMDVLEAPSVRKAG